jgi:hypothetical protein
MLWSRAVRASRRLRRPRGTYLGTPGAQRLASHDGQVTLRPNAAADGALRGLAGVFRALRLADDWGCCGQIGGRGTRLAPKSRARRTPPESTASLPAACSARRWTQEASSPKCADFFVRTASCRCSAASHARPQEELPVYISARRRVPSGSGKDDLLPLDLHRTPRLYHLESSTSRATCASFSRQRPPPLESSCRAAQGDMTTCSRSLLEPLQTALPATVAPLRPRDACASL